MAWRPATPLPKFNLDDNEELNWSLWLTVWGFRTENLDILSQFIKRKCADVKVKGMLVRLPSRPGICGWGTLSVCVFCVALINYRLLMYLFVTPRS